MIVKKDDDIGREGSELYAMALQAAEALTKKPGVISALVVIITDDNQFSAATDIGAMPFDMMAGCAVEALGILRTEYK